MIVVNILNVCTSSELLYIPGDKPQYYFWWRVDNMTLTIPETKKYDYVHSEFLSSDNDTMDKIIEAHSRLTIKEKIKHDGFRMLFLQWRSLCTTTTNK